MELGQNQNRILRMMKAGHRSLNRLGYHFYVFFFSLWTPMSSFVQQLWSGLLQYGESVFLLQILPGLAKWLADAQLTRLPSAVLQIWPLASAVSATALHLINGWTTDWMNYSHSTASVAKIVKPLCWNYIFKFGNKSEILFFAQSV